MKEKEAYMRRAIELAKQGCGFTNPNPMVGCVVVKDGRVISEGYHERCGEYHAERNALLRCREDCTGAELYVTLEPCCHYGKTPPCTEIIIEKGIKKVYVGSMDSNPLVGGKGVQILRDHGIEVETGILKEECLRMNEVFFHYIETKRPYVVMKYAMTLDGKIACATGDSKWVTGEAARNHVHELRRRYAGIMVGIGTVLADDPMLNCRICEGADPVRIVCDCSLRIPLESKLVRTAKGIPLIVACSEACAQSTEGEERKERLIREGVQVLPVKTDEKERIDLQELMRQLGAQGIDSILLEGGGTLNAAALEAGIVKKVYAYVAGKLVGGAAAKSPVEGAGVSLMSQAYPLQEMEIQKFGGDICISGYILRQDCGGTQRNQAEER